MAASRKSQLWPRITRARVPSLAHAEVPATPQSANAAGQRPPKKACGPRALPRPPQGLPRHARRAATRPRAGRRHLDVAWLGYARSMGERDGLRFRRRRRRAHHSEDKTDYCGL
jgi:hypothetical protein